MDVQDSEFTVGTDQIWNIGPADGFVVISDNNIFNVLAAATVFDSDNYADWQARIRAGDTYDPNSTRNDP